MSRESHNSQPTFLPCNDIEERRKLTQPLALAANLGKRNLVDAVPRALDDGGAKLLEQLPVRGRHQLLAPGRDDDAGVLLAHVQLAHQPEAHQLLARALLGVAVVEVPGGGLERGAARRRAGSVGIGVVVLAGRSSGPRTGRAGELLVAAREVVFLVADHVAV